MKKLFLLPVLLVALLMISCNGKPKTEAADKETSADKEAAILERGDSIYKESIAYWQGTQNIRQRFMGYMFMKNGKKTVLRHGEQKSYWKNGQLQAITPYKMGKKEGLEISYYEKGEKVYYERPYVASKKDGIVKKYYRSGRIMSETPYKQDFLGTGTKEYADSDRKKPLTAPTLKVWAKDERRENSRYIIYAKVVSKYDKTLTKVQFYRGMTILTDGHNYMHPNLKDVDDKKGLMSITLYDQGQGFPQFESISAKVTSSKGSAIFLTKIHQID